MSNTWRVPTDDVLRCPHCQGDASFVSSWTCRGLWGYKEVRTYECPDHGPIFVSSQAAIGHRPNIAIDKGSDDGNRDSLVSAPPKHQQGVIAEPIRLSAEGGDAISISRDGTLAGRRHVLRPLADGVDLVEQTLLTGAQAVRQQAASLPHQERPGRFRGYSQQGLRLCP